MQAARYVDGAVQLHDVPVPEPRPDEALIRVAAAGVCRSDLSLARGDWKGVPATSTIGHEAIGVVEALGTGAERFVGVGDRVIAGLGGTANGYWCGACEHCLRGRTRHCPQRRSVLGTFAEYVSMWAPGLVRLPATVEDHDAPLACGGVTAYSAVKKLPHHDVAPGRAVAVIGAAGGLGHYGVQLAGAFGYDVVGIDVGAERLAFVESLGVTVALDAADAVRAIQEDLGGVDAVLVFSSRISGFQLGFRVLRTGGLFVGVGVPPSGEGPFQLEPFEWLRKDPTLVYAAPGTVQDMRELVDLAAAGRVSTHVSRTGPLSELGMILHELEDGRYLGRAVVDDLAG